MYIIQINRTQHLVEFRRTLKLFSTSMEMTIGRGSTCAEVHGILRLGLMRTLFFHYRITVERINASPLRMN